MPIVYSLYREIQNSRYNISQQRLACHLFASKHNWEISQEFFENKSPVAIIDFNAQDGLRSIRDDRYTTNSTSYSFSILNASGANPTKVHSQ